MRRLSKPGNTLPPPLVQSISCSFAPSQSLALIFLFNVDVGVMDAFNSAIEQQATMVKAAGGWSASLSASVRPVVTYWILLIWSLAHFWYAWTGYRTGLDPTEVFKLFMSPDFSALLAGTINYWFLDRTLKQRGL